MLSQSSRPIVSPSAQEIVTCTLDMSQAPVLHGLKLGMTPDEVLALFPGSKDDPEMRAQLARPPSKLGTSSFVIRPERYENKAEFVGITQMVVTLLDGQTSGFTIHHNGPQWTHVDNFVAKFIKGTSLPPAAHWEPYAGLDDQMKKVTCADFAVTVFAGGEGGNLNYVQMQDLEAEKKLKERAKKARAKASPTPLNK